MTYVKCPSCGLEVEEPEKLYRVKLIKSTHIKIMCPRCGRKSYLEEWKE